MEKVCAGLKFLETFAHPNVKYHVVLSYTKISFGLLRFVTGNTDIQAMELWTTELPDQVKQFNSEIMYPYLNNRIEEEEKKDVVEKCIESV